MQIVINDVLAIIMTVLIISITDSRDPLQFLNPRSKIQYDKHWIKYLDTFLEMSGLNIFPKSKSTLIQYYVHDSI